MRRRPAYPDFEVNTLGTCKHIEWLLETLEGRRGGKKAFREGFVPPYSEVYLHYGPQRRIRFKAGMECPDDLRTYAAKYFDSYGYLRDGGSSTFERFVSRAAKADHEVRIYDDALDFVARQRDDVRRKKAIDRMFSGDGSSEEMNGLIKGDLYPYQQEIQRFTDRTVMVVEGPPPERRRRYEAQSFFKITNYDVIHRDLNLIESWAPDMLVLDEAQRIKNWKTRRARFVKQIDSDYALVLTGTPLENRLEKLHSIVEFVDRYPVAAPRLSHRAGTASSHGRTAAHAYGLQQHLAGRSGDRFRSEIQ